jgi:hypothetical protein
MADKSGAEFSLEIVKTFLWPALAVAAVIWLGPDLKEILKDRTFKIGLIEVGDRISNLKVSMQDSFVAQKDYLAKIKENATNPEMVRELTDAATQDIVNAQRGVKKEVQNIQEAIPQPIGAATNPAGISHQPEGKTGPNAIDLELQGFKAILARDVNAAISAFTEAEKIWPTYHNVAEIRRMLVAKRQALTANNISQWTEVYQHLVNELSWGMPAEIRQQIQIKLNEDKENRGRPSVSP